MDVKSNIILVYFKSNTSKVNMKLVPSSTPVLWETPCPWGKHRLYQSWRRMPVFPSVRHLRRGGYEGPGTWTGGEADAWDVKPRFAKPMKTHGASRPFSAHLKDTMMVSDSTCFNAMPNTQEKATQLVE